MIPAPEWTPTNREYHASPGWSSSMLRTFRESPRLAHARYVAKSRRAPGSTAEQRLGTAAGILLLHPEQRRRLIEVADADSRQSAAFKRTVRYADPDALVLTVPEYDDAQAIAASIHEGATEHAALARVFLVELPGYSEYAIRWDEEPLRAAAPVEPDPEPAEQAPEPEKVPAGVVVPCRSMVDRLVMHPSGPVIVELKTCADPFDFARTVPRWGYECQAAFNLRGIERHLGEAVGFRFVAVRNEFPFEVKVYEPDAEFLEVGAEDVQRDLANLARCLATDEWMSDQERVEGGATVLSLRRYRTRNFNKGRG